MGGWLVVEVWFGTCERFQNENFCGGCKKKKSIEGYCYDLKVEAEIVNGV